MSNEATKATQSDLVEAAEVLARLIHEDFAETARVRRLYWHGNSQLRELGERRLGEVMGQQRALWVILNMMPEDFVASNSVWNASRMKMPGMLLTEIANKLLPDARGKMRDLRVPQALGISLETVKEWSYLGIPEEAMPAVRGLATHLGVLEFLDELGLPGKRVVAQHGGEQ